jgi:zinc transport system substrate-binding protein
VFFKSFGNNKVIKNIANEVHVSVDTLQPLGNITADEAKQSLSFEDIMRINLEKMSKAMKCQ